VTAVRRGRRRALWISGAVIAALALIWLVGGYFVVVHPKLNHPTRADAVVVLGPPRVDGRFAKGVSLVKAGLAPNLVVSVGALDTKARHAQTCDGTISGVTIYCFIPDPATTRGEAEELRRLARQHGWTKLIVVTSTYHISRARFVFDRCFSTQIEMVSTGAKIGFTTWAYQYLYQSVGYLKAFTQSGC
jgi:uncharacterized SAM-binding protein YcdF (DUF218 family)